MRHDPAMGALVIMLRSLPRRDRDERPSIIEIDMAGGTTLRVDATVDDGALRRVLAVLRSLS
jgi:hypothetical protein